MDVAVIARVPFDEGTLTGTLTKETTLPEDDKLKNVDVNMSVSNSGPLEADLLAKLREHRWVRKPAPWSD